MTHSLQENKLRVEVVRTLSELGKWRDFWSTLQSDPESDFDFVRFIVRTRPEILHPYVLVALRGNQPVALVAARLERALFVVKIGYKTLWRTTVRRIAVFYGGFMGETKSEIARLVVRRLLDGLREERADILLWNGVQVGTDLHRQLLHVPGWLCRERLLQPVPHWRMTIPASVEELLDTRMKKKHRYWAKRLFRQIEKDFPQSVRLATFSQPSEMDRLFDEVLPLARKTYQWGLGVGLRDDTEHRERLRLEAANGWHRGYVLYVKEKPVAFWICILYRGIAYSAFTGYDPQYRKYELGTVVFLKMVGELACENVKLLDFGLGTALYKERFGDSRVEEASISTFAPTGRGILLNTVRLLTDGSVQTVRRLLSRFQIEQKLKRAWRRRAVQQRPVAEVTASQP